MLSFCTLAFFFFNSVHSQSNNVCPTWNESPNTNTLGGTDVPQARTLDDCKTACLSSTTACIYGFDWSISGGTSTLCWISRTSVTSPNQGTSHFTCPTIRTTPGLGTTTTTFPPGASARPACSSTWIYKQYNNSNIQGSIKQTSISSLDACQSTCLGTSWCSGIDWNANAGADERCWFSTKPQSDIKINQYPGVVHYHLVCDSGQTTDSSNAVTAAPPQGCSWTQFADTNTPNGIQVPTANSVYDCQVNCLARADKCNLGLDWNPGNAEGSRCYMSTVTNQNTASSITHYGLRCDSTTGSIVTTTQPWISCTWTPVNNANSPGGVLQSSLLTFEQCRDSCYQMKDTTCKFGFDWNPLIPQGSRCWFSTSTARSTYNGVTHYDLSCPTRCLWEALSDTNSPGGAVQSSITSLDQCRNTCFSLRTTLCRNGFDWNPSAPTGAQCWFSTSNSLTTYPGVVHYNCKDSQPSTGGGSFSTTTGPASCSWNTQNNTNSPGGILQSSVTSLDQCQSLCQQQRDTTCKYGIDWNPQTSQGTQCWFSQSNSTTPAQGIFHLTLICSGCTWNKMSNTNSPGGNVQPSATTLQQCQALCFQNKDTTCRYGYDFNPNDPAGSQCWHSTSSTTTAYNGVDHYNYMCTSPPGLTTTGQGVGCNWNKMINTNSPGGNVQPSATTLLQCQDLCFQNKDTTCRYGYDFNPNDPAGSQCWHSTSSTTTVYNGVDHYNYMCTSPPGVTPTGSGCTWTKQSNINSPGGMVQQQLLTQQQCQDACLQNKDTSCKFGYDFDNNAPPGSKCWFSVSGASTFYSGVDHYSYTCNGGLTAVTPTGGLGGCSWVVRNNTNSRGGSVQNHTSFESCRDACYQQRTTNCMFGFDFNPGNSIGTQCWFSQSNATNVYNGVYHYDLVCGNPATVAPIPACNWTEVANRNSPGGAVQESLPTLDACKNGCLQRKDTDCKFGIDFNPTSGGNVRCWFSANNNTLTPFSGNSHYYYSC